MFRLNVILHLLLIGSMIGCNRSPYDVAPVSGTVMLNDRPFPQGSVTFAPIAKGESPNVGRPGVGRIQPDGSFRISTFATNDGAIVGEHWVTIINHDEDNMPDGIPEFARIQVPEKKVVAAGKDNQFDIHLSRDEIIKYREDDR
jgi:hypothetical protein